MLRESTASRTVHSQWGWLPGRETRAAALPPGSEGPVLYCSAVPIMKLIITFSGDPPHIFIFHWALQIISCCDPELQRTPMLCDPEASTEGYLFVKKKHKDSFGMCWRDTGGRQTGFQSNSPSIRSVSDPTTLMLSPLPSLILHAPHPTFHKDNDNRKNLFFELLRRFEVAFTWIKRVEHLGTNY